MLPSINKGIIKHNGAISHQPDLAFIILYYLATKLWLRFTFTFLYFILYGASSVHYRSNTLVVFPLGCRFACVSLKQKNSGNCNNYFTSKNRRFRYLERRTLANA